MLTHLFRLALRPIYPIYEKYLSREVRSGPIPNHIAVILDGNRRYAMKRGFSEVTIGHEIGAEKVKEFLQWCLDLGIKQITLFAFSTENFRRSKREVERLMDLIEKKLYEFADDEEIHQKKVRIRVIGRRNLLPERVIRAIEKAEKVTENYDSYLLNVALAYGGRAELIDALRSIMKDVKNGVLTSRDITEKLIDQRLYTRDGEPPEVIIRTSGERRLSNFLLWQSTNTYLSFVDVYWPEVRRIDLLRGIRLFQKRCMS